MTNVHYFQRFSQRENVDTNNTLLLLSRVQATDPRLLRGVLAELFSDVPEVLSGLEVGVQFSQQTSAASGTVPDGMLVQSSFRIVVETKRTPNFRAEQLDGHLAMFGAEATKILLLLSPERTTCTVPAATKMGVAVVKRKFADVIAACKAAKVHEHLMLREIVEDFELYCYDSSLIGGDESRIMAVPTGITRADNLKLGLYYAPSERTFQRFRYLALYAQKEIYALGQVENIVCAADSPRGLAVTEGLAAVSDDQSRRILEAMRLAGQHGYDIRARHRFFLVQEFVLTTFRKGSPGGLFGKRYFDVREELGLPVNAEIPDVAAMATALSRHTWE